MAARKPIIALMYDFDKTLSPRDMQEYTFIPNLGMKPEDFWAEANTLAQDKRMDRILAYMYLMIQKSKAANQPIHREDFVKLGPDIELFPGVEDWFFRINQFGQELGVKIEHYIISSGLKEIIEGTNIYKAFRKIYACEFHYDVNGVADWPLMAVNYTAKTQFLYRINKGVLDISDDQTLNEYVREDERPVPFRNMIYFGDGFTDVPCMKLVKVNGGQSIAVYQNSTKHTAESLLTQDRVNYVAPADFSVGRELDKLVCAIIGHMAAWDALIDRSQQQHKRVERKNR